MENTAPPRATNLPAYVADRQGELTAHGIWALAQAVHGFCDKQRYPLWRFNHENHDEATIATWQQDFSAALNDWCEVRLWVEEYERDWGRSAQVYLSEREFLCCKHETRAPYRHPSTLALQPETPRQAPERSTQLHLGDLIGSRHGIDGLIYRLSKKCVAPYEAIDIPPLADETAANRMLWTWNHNQDHPMALAWPDLSGFLGDRNTPSPVLIPRAWGSLEKSFGWFGELRLHGSNSIIVLDEHGRCSIVSLVDMNDPMLGNVLGYWTQAGNWQYLRGNSFSSSVFEAAQSLMPDARGEVVCDLINGVSGERLNPPGIKVLAATLHGDFCIAINEAMEANAAKRLDLLDCTGRLMLGQGDPLKQADHSVSSPQALRWANLYDDDGKYRPVQSPDSGHWGFIDRHGAVAIEPKFARVWHFHQDLAPAWSTDTPDLMGLIDSNGEWAILPLWKSIHPQTRGQFVVQNNEDLWGAVDASGELIIPLQPRANWLQDAWIAEKLAMEMAQRDPNYSFNICTSEIEEEALIEGIARQRHALVKERVQSAKTTPPYTLSELEGVFDRDASQSDLREAGIWGMSVRVLEDQNEGILRPRAGQIGHIATYYPVGLSCFDLSVEAPVSGLVPQSEAVVGIPWRCLAVQYNE